MKYILLLALILSIYAGVPGGYRLVWSDEFNGNSIDSSKWGFDLGGGGWGNNELQYYTNRWDNAYVSNGLLHIRAKREYYGGRDYTSARQKENLIFNMVMLKLELNYQEEMEFGQLFGCLEIILIL